MKNKKGKKLVVLGAMAALLTLIGVSGSQTYAKYVESKTVNSESATVARWGFVVTESGDLFGEHYDNPDSSKLSAITSNGSSSTLTVTNTSTANNVVAPGTKGSWSINIKGLAEVDAQIKFATPDTLKDIILKDASSNTYQPLVWTLSTSVESGAAGVVITETVGTLAHVIDTLCGSFTSIEAGEKVDTTITLSWKWALESKVDSNGVVKDGATGNETKVLGLDDATPLTCDQADTFLAILASESLDASYTGVEYSYADVRAKYASSSFEVGFKELGITIEQVQNPIA